MLLASDAPSIAIAGDDAETQKWLPLPTPYTLDDAKRFIHEIAPATLKAGTGIVFAVERNDMFVGCIDVKRAEWLNGDCEIGFWTMPEHRGRGFIREGIARQAGRVHGGRVDLVIFSRVSSDLSN